jgi:hypothetical protein
MFHVKHPLMIPGVSRETPVIDSLRNQATAHIDVAQLNKLSTGIGGLIAAQRRTTSDNLLSVYGVAESTHFRTLSPLPVKSSHPTKMELS